jgi:biotin carboxylase
VDSLHVQRIDSASFVYIVIVDFDAFDQIKCCSVAGHVFAFGESRSLAIANMVLGLKEIQIRGEIRTNVDYTVDLLNV